MQPKGHISTHSPQLSQPPWITILYPFFSINPNGHDSMHSSQTPHSDALIFNLSPNLSWQSLYTKIIKYLIAVILVYKIIY